MDSNSVPQVTQNSSFRYYVIMILLGIMTTTATSSFVAPRVIMWWYDSPAPTPVSTACVPAIDWAIRIFQWTQLASLAVGALVGLVVAIRFRRKPQSNPLTPR